MPKIVQEIYPSRGGLNWDDDKRFMDPNDSDYRLNVVPNEYGNDYVVTNMKGTTLYSHSFSHSSDYAGAVYTPIGSVYDNNRDAVYFFIYSDLGNYSILRFNFSDHSFDKIVWDHTGIGLDINYPITDAFLIDDWLHFNPRSSSPRIINVQWAYYDFITKELAGAGNFVNGDYVKFLNKVYLCTSTISADSKPELNPDKFTFVDYCYNDVFPLNTTDVDAGALGSPGEYYYLRDFYNTPTILPYAPGAVIGTDTDYEYNNIRGRRFQFCYRHYVPDQGYTVASPFTGIVAAPSSETNKGEVIGDIQDYNKVTITFAVAENSTIDSDWYHRDCLFEFMEVLFREGPDDDWKVAERIDHTTVAIDYSGNIYSIDFYNDRAYEVVDNVAIEKQYNPLPIRAKAQWSLDGERSAYGGVTEGLNVDVGLDVTLASGYVELDQDISPASPDQTYGWTVTWDSGTSNWEWELTNNISLTDADAGDVIDVTISGVEYYHTLTAGDVASQAAYGDAMISLLAQGGISAYATSGPKIAFHSGVPAGFVSSIQLSGSATTGDLALKYGSFKNGAWHPFCLYYYDDAMRRSEPVFNSDFRIYMESLPEVLAGESTNYRRYIDWTIGHAPPQWAKYWRWGYAGNQTIDKFWQYNINALDIVSKDDTDDWTRIDISPLQRIDDANSGYDHYFPNTSIDAYSWERGDRVRFITTGIDSPATYDLLAVASEVKDYEILEFDDINHYIYIDELANPATTTTTEAGSDDVTRIIEIYRPKKQTGETVYYEYGELYSTYLSNGVYYHRGDSQDQTSGQDALGQFNIGDVWVITRLFSVSPLTDVDNAVFVESYGWSDFHETEGWGKGKAGAFVGIGETYLNNIRYSNKYSPNTKTSGLSTFDFGDYKELSTAHGDVVAMRQAGNTLKVYFERNSAGVLVNKQQIYNADGTSQIIKSDNVLGDAVYSNYHYGTIFPESVILKDRTVFFFDIYREVYVMDSANGLHPISSNKMRRYFHEKAVALRTSGISNVQVYSAYDYDYNMVYVHFIDSYDSNNDEVIMYHEPQDRWFSFMQLSYFDESSTTSTTTMTTHEANMSGLIFGHGSLRLVSFIGEHVHIHNSNNTRNNFWGNQYTSRIDFTFNIYPNIKKVLEVLAIHSNEPWDCTSIDVASDDTYENGMTSKVPEAQFKLREGIYCSNYFRNMKTNDSTANDLDLLRGEPLRGYYAEHRIVNDDTTEVKLFKIDVKGNISRI